MFFVFFICLLQSLHTISIDNVQEWKLKSFRENFMLVTTIDGYVRAIEPQSGTIKWSFKEDPILRTPTKIQHGFTFLPNPQDGELYFLRDGQIKKLPYSIPQLVSSSPCRTSDGVLYAGNKKDVWIEIDPINGVKLEEISISNQHSQCPINKNFTVFIGRSEYHLSMFDPENRKRQWNATYTDYSSHLLPPDSSYPYKHLASTTSGRLVTLDGTLQTILWDLNLGDTINAIYLLQKDGLHKLPYTVIGNEALDDLLKVFFVPL